VSTLGSIAANALYALAQPFVWQPLRIAGVAAGWLLVARLAPRPARPPLLVLALGWGGFGLLEFAAWKARSDIRVDLLVTGPALCLLTVVCVVLSLRRLRA